MTTQRCNSVKWNSADKIFWSQNFYFFQKEEKSTFSGKDCKGGGNNSGTVWEAGAFKYSCWRLYMSQKAFSTAPAEDLTQICFNHKFQKEYINNRGEKNTVGFKHTFWFFQLLASSSICEVRNRLSRLKKEQIMAPKQFEMVGLKREIK